MRDPSNYLKSVIRHAGSVVILDLSGRVTAGESAGTFRETIKELASAGHKNVLLNLKDISYVDSMGLGELVGACTTMRKLGGDVKLVNPHERVAYLLTITKVSSLFAIFTDEQIALQAFSGLSANS
jgi:anti-sigma B factor antagonist